jgi:crotonobetainyl-CoA:carnitine CoA-transferase CaiB-like acyl-CoA transferase
VRVGVAIVDLLTAHYGLSGVLAALYERERTGVGRRVEVVMVDTAAAFLSYAAQGYLADRREPPRLGSRHPNLVPYGAFPAADGWLAVGAGSETQWRRLCRALGREEWTEDPRYGTNEERVRHRGELEARLTEIFATAPVARWCEVFRAHEVPAGPVATLGTAVEAARERGQVVELPAGSGGVLPTVAAPWLFDGLRVTPAGGVPALGEGGGPAPETTP